MTTASPTVTVEEIGRVRRLTLNRPDHHNPLTPRCIRELLAAVAEAEADAGVRVIIIRSTGRSFSSGYGFIAEDTDPGDFPPQAAIESDVSAMLALGDGWARIWNCALPVIAQVQGNCLAGGTDLALHCDLVVAAEDAHIGFPPVRSMGVPPTNMWLYHLGPQWTKRLVLTGDTITGAEALRRRARRGHGAGRCARRRGPRPGRADGAHRSGPARGEQAGGQHGRRTDGPLAAAAVRGAQRRHRPPGARGEGVLEADRRSGAAPGGQGPGRGIRRTAADLRRQWLDVGQRRLRDAERTQRPPEPEEGRQADGQVEDLGVGERRPAAAR